MCLLVSGSLSFTACVCTHVVGRATLWWCECGFGQEQWGDAPGDHVGVGAGAWSPIRARPSRLFPYVVCAECACSDSCAVCAVLRMNVCVMCGAVHDHCCRPAGPLPALASAPACALKLMGDGRSTNRRRAGKGQFPGTLPCLTPRGTHPLVQPALASLHCLPSERSGRGLEVLVASAL